MMGSKKTAVLIAEDDPDVRALLHFLLEEEGVKVVTAENGAQALSTLAWYHPDLILTDLAMPEIDGLELIKRVRQQPELAKIPIVVMTTYRGNYLEAALCAGANAVLRKPDDFDHLMGTLSQVLPDSRTN
jgi:CheY-like chemotaxis protein